MRSQRTLLITTGSISLLPLLIYLSIIDIPLIYDTLLHIRITSDLTFWNVWLPTEAFGFYRPLTFLPFLGIRALFDSYPPVLLNLLNIGHHTANTAFLIAILYRLTRSLRHAAFVGLLFAIFPFSYQAVAVYGHNVHPQVTTVLLITLLFALRKRWGGVLACFIIGLLTHESFVLFGAFLGLWIIAQNKTDHWMEWQSRIESLRPAVAFTGAGVAYIVVYQFLPISRAPQVDAVAGSLWQKSLYLMQGMSWPLAWFGQFIGDVGAQPIILMSFLATALLSALVWREQWRVLLLGWGWWLFASALIAIPLPTGYLLNGPRLLYLGSIGVSIVWATIMVGFSRNLSSTIVTTLALGLIVVIGAGFVAERLFDYLQLTQGIRIVKEVEQPEAMVMVNLPQWIAPPQNQFPLGAEFVQQLGDYLFVEEWVGYNLNAEIPVQAVQVDDLLGEVGYGYGVHEQHEGAMISAETTPTDIYLTRYLPETTQFSRTGRIITAQTDEILAEIGTYTLHQAEAYLCDEGVQLTTVWSYSAESPPTATTTLFAQALDHNGALISQNDGAPLLLPPSRFTLQPNQHIIDLRTLEATLTNASQLLIGAYDYTTGERFAAFSTDGSPLPNDALSLQITPCR